MKHVGHLAAAIGLLALATTGAQAAPIGTGVVGLQSEAAEAATVQKTTYGWGHRRHRHYGYRQYGYAPYWGSGYGYYGSWSHRHRHHYHRRGW